jgi:hypothetical protein
MILEYVVRMYVHTMQTKMVLYDERYCPLERAVAKGIHASSSLGMLPGSGSEHSLFLAPDRISSQGDYEPAAASASEPSAAGSFPGAGHGSEAGGVATDAISALSAASYKSKDRATFMWGMWQCENEITMLLDESDVEKFPEGSLIISPQRWRVIKLGGRAIEFDETGIVSAMSKIDPNIPSLNISTSTTNCTLVPGMNTLQLN